MQETLVTTIRRILRSQILILSNSLNLKKRLQMLQDKFDGRVDVSNMVSVCIYRRTAVYELY